MIGLTQRRNPWEANKQAVAAPANIPTMPMGAGPAQAQPPQQANPFGGPGGAVTPFDSAPGTVPQLPEQASPIASAALAQRGTGAGSPVLSEPAPAVEPNTMVANGGYFGRPAVQDEGASLGGSNRHDGWVDPNDYGPARPGAPGTDEWSRLTGWKRSGSGGWKRNPQDVKTTAWDDAGVAPPPDAVPDPESPTGVTTDPQTAGGYGFFYDQSPIGMANLLQYGLGGPTNYQSRLRDILQRSGALGGMRNGMG